MDAVNKPHAVCIPLPAQGHINPMLNLAKLLHFKGFYITFVHTQFNFTRLSNSVAGLPDFRFETVWDGLPPENKREILDLPALCESMPTHCLNSFRELIRKLNRSENSPAVSCIVSDGVMGFTMKVAEEFGLREVLLFTPSGCGMLGYLQFDELIQRGYFPLKDERYLSNGYLDTEIDWVPSMKGIRLKDLPTFIRSTNPQDTMFNYNLQSITNALKTKTLILNTFDQLETHVLQAINTIFPTLYTIGPLSLLNQNLSPSNSNLIVSNLWKEDLGCLEWLNQRDPQSVLYVNYGSLVVMTPQELREFAWGLANSKYPFLWVIRPDMVKDGSEVLSSEYMEEISGRGLLVEWCRQEAVLSHPSIGGFLTHCGWNSVLESISFGVPMICWPFFAEQQTNCFFLCSKWGIGMEIDGDVRREKVDGIVKELMEGNKGKEMREKALEWRNKAIEATNVNGSSYINLDKLVKHLKG